MDFLSEERCIYCGINEGLVDAVTNEEVIRVCNDCARKNGFPVITKATLEQINASNKFYNKNKSFQSSSTQSPVQNANDNSRPVSLTTPSWVKHLNPNLVGEKSELRKENLERTSNDSIMSKIARAGNNTLDARDVERAVDNNLSRHSESENINDNKVPSYSHAYSSKLREIKGISGGILQGSKPSEKNVLPVYSDLVNNFHWHIQHGRRLKKISQKQLASMIAEKEEIIVLAEQGRLPEDYSKLISKLEQLLNIKIKTKEEPVISEEENTESSENDSEDENLSSGFFKSAKEHFKRWWDSEKEDSGTDSEKLDAQELVDDIDKK